MAKFLILKTTDRGTRIAGTHTGTLDSAIDAMNAQREAEGDEGSWDVQPTEEVN